MKTQLTLIAIAVAILTTACGAPQVDAKNFQEGQKQIVVLAAETPYRPCPPALTVPCEIAVLEGSPKEPGLFTIRVKMDQPFVLEPHSHPKAERVTVIRGRVNVGFGGVVEKGSSKQFAQGDYYVNRSGEAHFVWSDEPVELQITGIGPWEMHFAE